MNKSEIIAKEWLEQKYPNSKIYFRDNISPDFLVESQEEKLFFEVKRLYGKNLIFYDSQLDSITPETIILVATDSGIEENFLWKNKEQTKFKIIISNRKKNMSRRFPEELKKIVLENKHLNETTGETILRLLKEKKSEPIDYSRIKTMIDSAIETLRGGY